MADTTETNREELTPMVALIISDLTGITTYEEIKELFNKRFLGKSLEEIIIQGVPQDIAQMIVSEVYRTSRSLRAKRDNSKCLLSPNILADKIKTMPVAVGNITNKRRVMLV